MSESNSHQRNQKQNTEKVAEHERDMKVLHNQQDRLVNLYTLGEIDADTFSKKNTEFRDRIHVMTTQIEAVDRRRDDQADLGIKVFELSQSLADKWLMADYAATRRILEMTCLNFSLVGVTLVPEWRKPFDVLVEGLSVLSHRGDRI